MAQTKTSNPVGVSKTLAGWRAPSPSYTALSDVSFGPLQFVLPVPVPQMPDPTGVRGGNQPQFNKAVKIPDVLQVITPKNMRTF